MCDTAFENPGRMNNIKYKNPQVICNMDELQYRNAPGLAQSTFKTFLVDTPFHYKDSIGKPFEQTKDMIFGTNFHYFMLKPGKFKDDYAVMKDGDGRTKEYKEYKKNFEAENLGKTVIDEDDHGKFQKMCQSVLKHPVAGDLYLGSKDREMALFATAVTPEGGEVRLKGLLDMYDPDTGIISDFKKCQSASKYEVEKMVRQRGYWVQAAQYTWLAIANGLVVNKFVIIAVEDDGAHATGCYEIDIFMKMKFKNGSPATLWANALSELLACEQSGIWPGYSDEIETVEI